MTDHIPDTSKKVGRPQIREVFLRNGARVEPDRDDLPDWVYESAFELLEMAAPAVQGEPVLDAPFGGILYLQVDGKPDQWRRINPCRLYTAPQPAEQQPAPDVAALVAALEEIENPIKAMRDRLQDGEHLDGFAAVQLAGDAEYLRSIAREALAAHRSQGVASEPRIARRPTKRA